MMEAIKRLIMAVVFFYLGGYTLALAACFSLDAPPIEAIVAAAQWPMLVASVTAAQFGILL